MGFLLCIFFLNGVGKKLVYVGFFFMGGVVLLFIIFFVKYGFFGKSFFKMRVYKDVIENSLKEWRVNFKLNKVIYILCLNCIVFELFLYNFYFCLLVDIEWIMFLLFFVGMIGFFMVVVIFILYFIELFLIVVRNFGFGIVNLCGCIGGIIVFYIFDLVFFLYMFLIFIVILYLFRC